MQIEGLCMGHDGSTNSRWQPTSHSFGSTNCRPVGTHRLGNPSPVKLRKQNLYPPIIWIIMNNPTIVGLYALTQIWTRLHLYHATICYHSEISFALWQPTIATAGVLWRVVVVYAMCSRWQMGRSWTAYNCSMPWGAGITIRIFPARWKLQHNWVEWICEPFNPLYMFF